MLEKTARRSKAEKTPITQGGRRGCILGPKPSRPGSLGAQRQSESLVWVGRLQSHPSLGDLIYTVNHSQSTRTSRESTIWRSTHEQACGEKRNDNLPSQRARKQPSGSQSWSPSAAAALQPGWGGAWTHTRTCTQTHTQTQTHTDTHTQTQTGTHTDIHRQTHTQTHRYTQTHTQTYADTQTHTETHRHRHTQIHTDTHRDIHRHRHIRHRHTHRHTRHRPVEQTRA